MLYIYITTMDRVFAVSRLSLLLLPLLACFALVRVYSPGPSSIPAPLFLSIPALTNFNSIFIDGIVYFLYYNMIIYVNYYTLSTIFCMCIPYHVNVKIIIVINFRLFFVLDLTKNMFLFYIFISINNIING
jgi:hypothetical protein